MPRPIREARVELLADHTQTAAACWFAVWEGWGAPSNALLEF